MYHSQQLVVSSLNTSQASNARIMNKGTDQNIMTQLGITSNGYNLVTVLYYVRDIRLIQCVLITR
jgi:hypothetical protein